VIEMQSKGTPEHIWNGIHPTWDAACDAAKGVGAQNQQSLIIPEGFAHNFQMLSDNVTLLYCSQHRSQAEAALNAQDPRRAINWPLAITEISSRDLNHPHVSAGYEEIKPGKKSCKAPSP